MKWPLLFLIPFALAKLEKKSIHFSNGKSLSVEVAQSSSDRQKGLMGRTELKENTGMLFVFKRPQQLSFWMKNTYIPLSIGFFDENKKLFDIQKMEPVKSVMDQDVKHYRSRGRAKYALEVNQGWFARNGIKKGMTFQFLKMPKAKPQKKKK